jgi:hypothetical protein
MTPAHRLFVGELLKLLELRNPHLTIRKDGADLQLTTERLNIVGQRAERVRDTGVLDRSVSFFVA